MGGKFNSIFTSLLRLNALGADFPLGYPDAVKMAEHSSAEAVPQYYPAGLRRVNVSDLKAANPTVEDWLSEFERQAVAVLRDAPALRSPSSSLANVSASVAAERKVMLRYASDAAQEMAAEFSTALAELQAARTADRAAVQRAVEQGVDGAASLEAKSRLRRSDLQYDFTAVDAGADRDKAELRNGVDYAGMQLREFTSMVQKHDQKLETDIQSAAARAANENRIQFARARREAVSQLSGTAKEFMREFATAAEEAGRGLAAKQQQVYAELLHARQASEQDQVDWAANKSFEISKFEFKFPRARTYELIRVRSRLYRSQICK